MGGAIVSRMVCGKKAKEVPGGSDEMGKLVLIGPSRARKKSERRRKKVCDGRDSGPL